MEEAPRTLEVSVCDTFLVNEPEVFVGIDLAYLYRKEDPEWFYFDANGSIQSSPYAPRSPEFSQFFEGNFETVRI